MTPGARLREVLAQPGCAMAMGAHDPAIARLVEIAGFPVVYVSGSASSTTVGGFPDVGLLGFTELLDHARHIIRATKLPVLCDVDTGFGNVTNVRRTIREFEQAGAAGVHMEDQVFPKRCGQTTGASVIPVSEMVAKIYAAKEAQSDPSFLLVVRSDARQCEGFDALVNRGRAYVEAGADAIFPEALRTPDEFRRYRDAVSGPLVIDVPEWGLGEPFTISDLESWGFSLGIFAVTSLRIALGAIREMLRVVVTERTQHALLDRMVTRDEMDDLLGLSRIRADEMRLTAKSSAIDAVQS